MKISIIRQKFLLLIFLFISVLYFACSQTTPDKMNRQFTNPILSGFYPDPSICKVGSDFYMVNSTFSYFPGIPVFHSKNLVKWELIGHVLDRPEQMNLDGLGVSRGVFAPTIRYNDGKYYVVCTLVDAGGNFVVTSDKPEGPWSNPVWLPEINGIDPSIFFDDDGKSYIIFNSIPPNNISLYSGHRTIRLIEFDKNNLKVKGENIVLVNGGTDISKKPVWIEAPHIFKVNGVYYLICAEGGTGENHSEVVFKSDHIKGPYTPYKNNPILTQRKLDPKRPDAITCTGHADFVQLDSGDWWAIFLGCRPYAPCEDNYYNTGRETFLAPVKWIDSWPVINPDFELVQYKYDYPIQSSEKISQTPYGGNFTVRDDFDAKMPGPDWIYLRTPREKWYDMEKKSGQLLLQLRPETCSGKENPSFIGRRQQHQNSSATTALIFNAKSANEKAGLLIFQSENNYYFLCKSISGQKEMLQLFKSVPGDIPKNQLKLLKELQLDTLPEDPLYLRIESKGKVYNFSYSVNGTDWLQLMQNVDGTFLCTKLAGGFVGSLYALYATSMGKDSKNIANFSWFEYSGNDVTNN